MIRTVTVLGSTGSVGVNTLDVIAANRDAFAVEALTAGRNVALLAEQAKAIGAKSAVIADETLYTDLKERLSGTGIHVAAGRDAVIAAASRKTDITLCAILGFAGLEPLMASIANGGHVAIANKEPLVAAGPLVMAAARETGATILPVDSEHNAVFQTLEPQNIAQVEKIILTASGGPFRTWPLEDMKTATPEQALKHPNWSMGAKISIDSATMMNKALEVIEAHYLFNLPPEKIEVLVHPQSVVHALVAYTDGSMLAQMGAADMRVPIAHALGWPERVRGSAKRLDLTEFSGLTFEKPDTRRFPAISHAYDCLEKGAYACCAMNAANEVAVAAFLEKRIGFTDIFTIVRQCVEAATPTNFGNLQEVVDFDLNVRSAAQEYILNTASIPEISIAQGRHAS